LNSKKTLPFSKNYLQQQATKVFEFLKDFKTNENIAFSEFLNLLHLDEETYILNLGIKLMKPQFFIKQTPSILKPMHLTYVMLLYGMQIHIFNLFYIHMQLHHIVHHTWLKLINLQPLNFIQWKKFILDKIDANIRI